MNEAAIRAIAEAIYEYPNEHNMRPSVDDIAEIISKHLSVSVPDSAFTPKHLGFPEQSPRVCVKCMHSEWWLRNGRCANFQTVEYDEAYHENVCGCACEFPASVADGGVASKSVMKRLAAQGAFAADRGAEWIDEYQAAMKIAIYLSQNFYPMESWVPEPTLMTVLTQIDNMVAGLPRADGGVEAMRRAILDGIKELESLPDGEEVSAHGIAKKLREVLSISPASQVEEK